MMMRLSLGISTEEIQDIFHAELADGFAFDGGLGQGAFFVLEGEDALFDGVGDGEFVDGDIHGLVEAVDAVDGLFFDELLFFAKENKVSIVMVSLFRFEAILDVCMIEGGRRWK